MQLLPEPPEKGDVIAKLTAAKDASDNKTPSPPHSMLFNWFFEVIYTERVMCPHSGWQ